MWPTNAQQRSIWESGLYSFMSLTSGALSRQTLDEGLRVVGQHPSSMVDTTDKEIEAQINVPWMDVRGMV